MSLDWRNMPPLTALRAFEATARLFSFSAAGRELSVTHAAIAQQVRALEDHLGVALVHRDGRGLAMTDAGQRLAQTLTEGFGIIKTGVEVAKIGNDDRSVRVTLSPEVASQWLMPRLRDFWSRHPDIALSLNPDHAVVDLRRESMDVAIRYGRGIWPGVEARRLTSARLVVAGAPSLVGGKGGFTVSEMAEMPWVLTSDWPEQSSWMRSIGLPPETLRATVFPNEGLALAAARQGLGLVVESYALLEDDIDSGRIRLVYDTGDAMPAYFIVTLPGQQRKAVRQFLDWLSAQA